MRPTSGVLAAMVLALSTIAPASAQTQNPPVLTVTCASDLGGRQHCAADTSAGVALVRSMGVAPCLLGRTWGYDGEGVWVSDGCAGEFVAGVVDQAQEAIATKREPPPHADRFLFGTDEVAPKDQAGYLKVYEQYGPLWAALSPETKSKVLRTNYERLFDEARRRVRAWEKENVR